MNDELSLEEVKKIIDQLVDMKVFNVCFLGGEPPMRKDFIEILKYGDQIHIHAEETYSWLLEEPPESSAVIPSIKNLSCVADTSQLVISPNGLVFPCPFLHEFVAGDLRKEKTLCAGMNPDLSPYKNL